MTDVICLNQLVLILIGFLGGLFWGWVFTSTYYTWKCGTPKTTKEILEEMN